MVYDGANIWVTNTGSSNVIKIRASDGSNLGTFVAGASPVGISFDGSNVWVANQGGNTVSKF
jgi:DNA-binding beta-propeller fold protein YncE